MNRWFVLLAMGFVWLPLRPVLANEQISLQTRPGVTQSVLYKPAASAVRSAILFTGGHGGATGMGQNFLMRVADNLVAQGISVAVPELPSDQRFGMSDAFRVGPDHAVDMAAVVGMLKQRAAVPVWLIGTSRGTLSAASVAARLGPVQVSGLVLTSTVWPLVNQMVTLGQIGVPTLIVHNELDGCRESPFSGAEPGLAALRSAPVEQLVVVQGGFSKSAACEALSPHGYYGIEDQVVTPVVAWIKAH